jgi:hypothetical protein
MQKKLLLVITLMILSNVIKAQSSINFKYINTFYDEISFEEYENNKTTFSEFKNKSKLNFQTIIKDIDSINVKSKIKFSSKNKNYLVIKLKKINLNKELKLICLENEQLTDLPYPYSTILKLKGAFLMEFYSSNNNQKYPEINKFKPLVKDSDGVLNIYKLADIIEKNKVTLFKYLDE